MVIMSAGISFPFSRLLILVGPRHTKHMLPNVCQHQIIIDGRCLVQTCFTAMQIKHFWSWSNNPHRAWCKFGALDAPPSPPAPSATLTQGRHEYGDYCTTYREERPDLLPRPSTAQECTVADLVDR